MELGVWVSFFLLFMAGGLTPGPAVMLVTTSSIRYGFGPAMIPSAGVCLANLVWIVLAVTGATALAHAFPAAFVVLKVVGISFILFLAWRTAFGAPVDLLRREPPPRARLLATGVGLQLLNPNALVYFAVAMPGFIDASRDLVQQAVILMVTVTLCEMFGLMVYAYGADALARRFQSSVFARWFFRIAAATMAGSALFAVFATWSVNGS
jgi:threonine/homoserine/homoserine lactone efflux protein